MDSLYNDYGQLHIVAYHCEQKLLAAPRLKTKDPKGLKTLSVLMDKCVAMLRDVQDFATLNSLGTIQRIIEKLPEQTQKDWAKWSYHEFKTTGRQARFEELVRYVPRRGSRSKLIVWTGSVWKPKTESSCRTERSNRTKHYGYP